jgi:hypothetical protein
MADYINNVAAGDAYTAACTLGPNFEARDVVITIANNPALMQFAVGKVGDWRWTDEREFFSIPQSFRVSNVIGVKIRNANPGQVARVLVVLSGSDDPGFDSGIPFTGVLSAGGGVTPGGGSVEIDHNGLAISTQPKVDFEDAVGFVWSIVDDPANTRAKITAPPRDVAAAMYAGLAAQIFGSGAFAQVQFDKLDFDPYGFCDLANDRLVVPAGRGGDYIVTAGVEWAAIAGSTQRSLHVLRNGVTIFAGTTMSAPGANFFHGDSRVVALAAGDVITSLALQASGGALNSGIDLAPYANFLALGLCG